ncbi:Ferrochelatase-2, chloroplastic [Tetrabaena socialis]|uniref:Ferrochelatase n=1 Tax=Tetrabaena socialis TaxID=47790 RepID=A0A2J8A8H6_9CHLO|nr:Ferrochelatase-2, chloroplastic [Tetrabaena socialis]|eukprot:PNH08834.1 Ferrochelatase-2, chloroplastic [Tetrabaena socialis]
MASFGLHRPVLHPSTTHSEAERAGCSGRCLPVLTQRHRNEPADIRGSSSSPIVASPVLPVTAGLSEPTRISIAASSVATEKIGVLLLNLGGPGTLKDIKPFLYNLFADPDIIRLPPAVRFLQPLIATIISTLRAPKSTEGYKAIGGGSPLRRITDEQACALAASLTAKGQPANVYVGMRYWHPYTEEALEQIKADGVSRLVILPLYPQFSISTSGSSLRLLEGLFKTDKKLGQLRHTVIPSWYQRRGYVCAMADLIEQELLKFKDVPSVEVFFSAHGVPKSYVEEAGDPYKEEMEECVRLIMDETRRRGFANTHTLAYQSRVGPAEWLKPYTDESIRWAAGVWGRTGDLEMLLQAYDRERRTLPSPVEMWQWGWTKSAEMWNGRIAMLAIIIILLLEATSGQSILKNLIYAE